MAAVAGIVVALVMLATGQIDAEAATTSITALIGLLIASIAYEDGAAKSSSVTHIEASTKDDTASVTTTSTGSGGTDSK